MSDSTSLVMESFQNPNPNPNYTDQLIDNLELPEFEFSDYLIHVGGSEDDSLSSFTVHDQPSSQNNPVFPENINDDSGGSNGDTSRSNNIIKCKNGVKKNKIGMVFRIAFRTKSEIEVMDDGFKWRKYGKKIVKNSPYPRNYYRCSNGDCNVKKRVEKDCEDPSYVITTYEGVHNHESPCVVYYNQMPLMVPSGWTLQASHSSSS